VASRWPWRLPLAAAMSRLTSALGLGQVLAGPQLAVGEPPGGDCSFYGGWRDQLEVRFGHVIRPMLRVDCSYKNHFSNSKSIPMRRRGERTAGPTLPDVAQPRDRLCWKSHAARRTPQADTVDYEVIATIESSSWMRQRGIDYPPPLVSRYPYASCGDETSTVYPQRRVNALYKTVVIAGLG
jgi:hypothetical protein